MSEAVSLAALDRLDLYLEGIESVADLLAMAGDNGSIGMCGVHPGRLAALLAVLLEGMRDTRRDIDPR